ncbi:YncE family protein [Pseudomonas sp. SBB6]|uniref:YncE family protein n=1 Tax=Pseudomonas sp. SBB6 TaxID=2962032 RepID=UPI0020B7A39C|nr:hypothetical protein [Pseudomonas sp. SBB6]MCP3752595.1 hypothetical protein [Pseudomonas sp. SBB6]
MTRAEAPFALRAQRQSLSPRNLERLRVPLGDLIDVLVEDDDGELIPGDAGVNLALTDDPRGLAVGIPLWANAQAFEEIEVYWGGSVAVIHFLSAAELDAPEGILYLRVPLRRLLDGQAEVSYTVWHLDGNSSESAAIRVLVKRTRPGGRDDDAEQPGHQGLVPAGLGDELIESGIGPIEAAAGVDVSIAAYEHMRVRDRIELDWGGERLVHVVAADEVGQDLTLVVEEALILAAGDGEIKIAWKVTDEVLNSSRDADERPWSASTTVEVYASDAQLYPPYVKIRDEYVDEVIDLNELDLDDVTVEVFTDPQHFEKDHWVELFWNGFTADGERVQHRQQAQVERVPGAVTFMVPNGQAQLLGGGGRVVLHYQVKAGETTPPLNSSQRTTRRIEGEGAGIGLRAPTVLEAQGGYLDPSLGEATIRVAAYPGIKIGDVLTVVFSGTRADGGEVYFDHTRNVTSGQIEAGEVLRYVPGEYIAALDGRRAEVYYLVNGRRSETLGLVIGELQATLQAPTVLEVDEGVLDPAAVGAQGATLEIPLYEGIALGDRVTYLWRGSEADGSTSDQSEISSLSEPLVFDVPKQFVEANLNGSVEVNYSVERDGHPGLVSRVFSFRVGVLALELDAPTVVQAPGGILDPLDALTGATVEVSYAGMSVSDQITLHWRGTAIAGSAELGPFAGDASGTLLIDIAVALVGANIGPASMTVQLSYSVERSGQELAESPVLPLIIQTLAQLPTPGLPQAENGVIDLNRISGNPAFRTEPWHFMAAGQRLWLRLHGEKKDGSEVTFPLWTAQSLTNTLPLTRSIPRADLEQLKDGSTFTLELKVSFDRSVNEGLAVEFLSGVYTINHKQLAHSRTYTLSHRPISMILGRSNAKLYVTLEHSTDQLNGSGLAVLDLASGQTQSLMSIRADTSRAAVNANETQAWKGCYDGLRVIDLNTLQVTHFTPVPYGASSPVINAAGTRVYFQTIHHASGVNVQKLSILDTSNNAVIKTIDFPMVSGLTLSHDGQRVLASANGFSVLDAQTLSLEFSIPLTDYCSDICVSGNNQTVFALIPNKYSLAIIDLASRSVRYVSLGSGTYGRVLASADNWVATEYNDALQIVDIATGSRLQALSLNGGYAWDAVIDDDNSVYACTRQNGTVMKFS